VSGIDGTERSEARAAEAQTALEARTAVAKTLLVT
jgi:hypothetical protein